MTEKQMQRKIEKGRRKAHKRMERIRQTLREANAAFEAMSPAEKADAYAMQHRLKEKQEIRESWSR